MEPLHFLDPYSEKLDWNTMRIGFQGAGLADRFDYIKQKFRRVHRERLRRLSRPVDHVPHGGEEGDPTARGHSTKPTQSTIINHKATRQEWLRAVEKWRAAGGDKIIAEVNQLQKDKTKPKYASL